MNWTFFNLSINFLTPFNIWLYYWVFTTSILFFVLSFHFFGKNQEVNNASNSPDLSNTE